MAVPTEFTEVLSKAFLNLMTPGFGKSSPATSTTTTTTSTSHTAALKHVRQLQSLIADPSGCAVLVLLLKILYNPDIIQVLQYL